MRENEREIGALLTLAALSGAALAGMGCNSATQPATEPATQVAKAATEPGTKAATKTTTESADSVPWNTLEAMPAVGSCRTPGVGESMAFGDWVATCCTRAACAAADSSGSCAVVPKRDIISLDENRDFSGEFVFRHPKGPYQPAKEAQGAGVPDEPCCYVVEVCTHSGAMYGRPFVVSGQLRMSGVRRRSDWGAARRVVERSAA